MREKKLVLLTENCDPRQAKLPNWEPRQAEPFNRTFTTKHHKSTTEEQTEKSLPRLHATTNIQTKHQETIVIITVMKRLG